MSIESFAHPAATAASPRQEMGSGSHRERQEKLERRGRTLLVCPDNDPEAHMILLLAEKMGMVTLQSGQMHGATLDREEDFLARVAAAKKGEVWIVEIPGPELEAKLREDGLMVHVIDHHTYGALDRVRDVQSGARKRSSLEQFLEEAGITDKELQEWGYEPKTVRGLGIFDDRFAQGLRDEGYAPQEIAAVVDLGTRFTREMNPVFEEIAEAAEGDWNKRKIWNGYILVISDFYRDVRGAISHRTIREGVDTQPLIVSSCAGRKIFVQGVDPSIVQRLQREIPPENTFTFGAGRCWGYDAKRGPITVRLEKVLRVLEMKE